MFNVTLLKVLDATAVIAFLGEMNFHEGLEALSDYYEVVITPGVVAEITKEPTKSALLELIDKEFLRVVQPNRETADTLRREHPQLHTGECEAIAYAIDDSRKEKCYILSDDLKARKIFPGLDFKWTEALLDHMLISRIIDENTHSLKTTALKNSNFYSRNRRFSEFNSESGNNF